MSHDEEPFLRRWSRRKTAARLDPAPPAPVQPADAADAADVAERSEPPGGQAEPDAPAHALTEADFADVEFEKLDMSSDYTRFLQQGVPDAIRQRALRQLWASDPVFSAVEVFNEYGGDFTDKAVAVPAGTLQTAWRFGKGFLTDDEAAAWDRLAAPPAETAVDAAAARAADPLTGAAAEPIATAATGEGAAAHGAGETEPSNGSNATSVAAPRSTGDASPHEPEINEPEIKPEDE